MMIEMVVCGWLLGRLKGISCVGCEWVMLYDWVWCIVVAHGPWFVGCGVSEGKWHSGKRFDYLHFFGLFLGAIFLFGDRSYVFSFFSSLVGYSCLRNIILPVPYSNR